MTFSDSDNDGIVSSADIKQINHYYPFGLNMEGNWNGASGNNKYQYNNKEWNDDFGLGWNDYGFRLYDPTVGRWWVIDALTEKHTFASGYVYVLNNPIIYKDFLGLDTLKEVTVTASRPKTSESWQNFISQWSYEDFQSFRRDIATPISQMQNFTIHTQSGIEGVDITGVEHSTEEATDEEAMDLLKDWWAQENSIDGTNYLAIRAETISDRQQAVNLLTQTSITLISSWIGTRIPLNSPMRWSITSYRFTRSSASHFTDIVTKNKGYKGKLARPYYNSNQTIREIMSTGRGVRDKTAKGALKYNVEGTFRGTHGTWELVIDPKRNKIFHFNFVGR